MTRRIPLIILLLLLLLPVGAHAQMPVHNPLWVHVGPPWFEGVEAIYSSATATVSNYYGNYWIDIPAGGGSNWEVDNNYRGGNPALEPIAAHDGLPVLGHTATLEWFALHHDTVDFNIEASEGDIAHYTTGAGNDLRMYAPGQVPTVPSANYVYMLHDAADAEIGSGAGDLNVTSASGDVGVHTAAPTANMHIVGNLRVQDGTEGVGCVFTDDGTGTGTGVWALPGAPAGIVEFTAEATVAVAGCDAGVFDTGDAIADDFIVWLKAREINGGVYWNPVCSIIPVADTCYYYYYENGAGNLEVAVVNDTQLNLEITVAWVNY